MVDTLVSQISVRKTNVYNSQACETIDESENSVVNSVIKSIKLLKKYSKTFEEKQLNTLPTFNKSEIHVGKILGEGSYSSVFEIRSIKISLGKIEVEEKRITPSHQSILTYEKDKREQNKLIMANHCLRPNNKSFKLNSRKHGDARYAIKFLKPEVMSNPCKYERGAIDLAREGAILASLSHPNIIRLRGLSSAGPAGFETKKPGNYFLIMDRLYDTLEQRMEKWSSSLLHGFKANIKFLFESPSSTMKKKRILLMQRLLVAYDLAQALQYLHCRNIIYRDIKPENIGFDVRGEVKLFDFGIAIELIPEKQMENGLYSLAGSVGTPRYMAPEIIKHRPYNLSADIYSFGILLWQICSLRMPYAGYDDLTSFNNDIAFEHKRPKFNEKLRELIPTQLQKLIRLCWAPSLFERPTISLVIQTLKEEIEYLKFQANDTNQTGITMRLDNKYYRRKSSTGWSFAGASRVSSITS